MIKNIWQNITFYCGHNHSKPVKMELQEGPSSVFYACPKYKPENREPGERACGNRMNLINAQKLVEHYSQKLEEFGLEGGNLTNYEWDYKTIHAKVLKQNDHKINIEILDKKAIKGKTM